MKLYPGRSGDIRLRKRLITIGILFVVTVIIFLLKGHPNGVERYYSGAVYPLVRYVWQIFGWLPFSLGDLFYILIVIALIWGSGKLVLLIFRRQWRNALFLLSTFFLRLEILIIAFYFLWAINYFRMPAQERLNLPETAHDQELLLDITSKLIDSLNSSRQAASTVSGGKLKAFDLSSSVSAMKTLRHFETPQRVIGPAVKTSLLSPLVSHFGTAGYFNPFTGEAQYNADMPAFTVPFIACHEIAHQIGFGSEDEASFIAFVAGKSSSDPLLRYSSYYNASQEFMTELWRTDSLSFKSMKLKLSADVLSDMQQEQEFWMQFRGGAAHMSSIFYDHYLKANKQPEGLMTYNRMIRLTMAYYRKYP